MKHLVLLAVLALLLGTNSSAFSDTTTAPTTPHPRIAEVKTRVHDQIARIKAGVNNGTLTKEQAKALHATLKAVHEQMEADFTTNGKHELTEDQLKQLNQMLDENSKTIYGEKHSGANSGTGSSSTGSSSTGSDATGSTSTGTGSAGSSSTGSSSTGSSSIGSSSTGSSSTGNNTTSGN